MSLKIIDPTLGVTLTTSSLSNLPSEVQSPTDLSQISIQITDVFIPPAASRELQEDTLIGDTPIADPYKYFRSPTTPAPVERIFLFQDFLREIPSARLSSFTDGEVRAVFERPSKLSMYFPVTTNIPQSMRYFTEFHQTAVISSLQTEFLPLILPKFKGAPPPPFYSKDNYSGKRGSELENIINVNPSDVNAIVTLALKRAGKSKQRASGLFLAEYANLVAPEDTRVISALATAHLEVAKSLINKARRSASYDLFEVYNPSITYHLQCAKRAADRFESMSPDANGSLYEAFNNLMANYVFGNLTNVFDTYWPFGGSPDVEKIDFLVDILDTKILFGHSNKHIYRKAALYMTVGHYYTKMDDLSKAENYFRKAAELRTDTDISFCFMVKTMRLRRKYDEAVETIEKFLEANPAFKNEWYLMVEYARSLKLAGQIEKGNEVLARIHITLSSMAANNELPKMYRRLFELVQAQSENSDSKERSGSGI